MDIAGIILAGGLGTRMGHVKKAFLTINGRTILDRLLAVYRPLFPEILIAARDKNDYKAYDYPIAEDRFEARSSLTGIHAGLTAMRASHGFMAACDGPFLQPGLVQALLDQADPEYDVIIPLKEDGYVEPLCAIYSKRCIPHIEAQLEQENFRIIGFFDQVRVKEVPVSLLQQGDPHHVSFFNVNSPDDLRQAEHLAAELGI
ncbi:MAG: molybdenum cofactor guanylyltransferase [Pseudodesulfovibrio sp.]|uniref:molybdenum cofactor guanylyltransferase n=1 Tax=Pseudodesulfovibrio sp. TaxID=2035812 RepID=UPI003D1320E7